jgi:hypothetical protein
VGSAQDDEPKTIKVKKESNLAKVVFDNTDLRLMVVDRFGNPKENKIVSYKLWIKSKAATRELEGYTNRLTPDMVTALRKEKKATKIFFTELTVQDDDGHLVKLPDVIDTWFPDCVNCEGNKPRRR